MRPPRCPERPSARPSASGPPVPSHHPGERAGSGPGPGDPDRIPWFLQRRIADHSGRPVGRGSVVVDGCTALEAVQEPEVFVEHVTPDPWVGLLTAGTSIRTTRR